VDLEVAVRSLALLYDRLIAGGINWSRALAVCERAAVLLRTEGRFRIQVDHLWLSGHMTAHGLEME
jgi:hypothetical protein